MYLDDLLAKQKQGEARGIFSVCSAHPYVIQQTLKTCHVLNIPPLIEATCNQVNQFGGYTGMQPADFVKYVYGIAERNQFPVDRIILGGDHLGPSVWQHEPEKIAMPKAEDLIQHYIEAGFQKIHLDCSMRLADDPPGPLNIEVSAQRAARLARTAEDMGIVDVRYVIGTEVPVPGGTTEHEDSVQVSGVEDVLRTIEVTRDEFFKAGLHAAWERVIAIVVQPGVEFGDDFVLPYQPEKAADLSRFIEGYPLVYEAHSTDYQTRQALSNLVWDHFAILKVGPALTFAFREAVFLLAQVENELLNTDTRSNIIPVLDEVMEKQPQYWRNYYQGNEQEIAHKRKFSFSDRIRYYWTQPSVKLALDKLMTNLGDRVLPETLLKELAPEIFTVEPFQAQFIAEQVISTKIQLILNDYAGACNPKH